MNKHQFCLHQECTETENDLWPEQSRPSATIKDSAIGIQNSPQATQSSPSTPPLLSLLLNLLLYLLLLTFLHSFQRWLLLWLFDSRNSYTEWLTLNVNLQTRWWQSTTIPVRVTPLLSTESSFENYQAPCNSVKRTNDFIVPISWRPKRILQLRQTSNSLAKLLLGLFERCVGLFPKHHFWHRIPIWPSLRWCWWLTLKILLLVNNNGSWAGAKKKKNTHASIGWTKLPSCHG